jgi:hypothetical protein
MAMPLTYRALLDLSEDELIEIHDQMVESQHINVGINYFLEALRHKAQDTQTKQLLSYTRWITLLTLIVTLATIVNVVIAYRLVPR